MKTTNKFLALATMSVTMVFASCSKDNDDNPAVPTQQEIETKIIGKWKRQIENGKPVPTNVSTVLTFAKDGQSSHSFYYYDEANKRGVMVAHSPFEFTITGNELRERELRTSYYSDVVFYADITAINDKELCLYNKKRTYDGKEEVTDDHRTYTRVTADYSKDIIGLWRGVDSENDLHGGSHHYWAYREDGTYTYFTQNEEGVWGAFDNTLNEYVVDGDWLATHWVKDGVDNYESWNIDRIEGDRMYWSALRDNNGKQEKASFVLERANIDFTAKFTIANVMLENADPDNKTDVYEVDFADNDVMGVHVLTGSYPNFTYDPMNLKYAVSGNGKNLTANETPIELTDKVVSILAYYPYKTPYDPAYELKVFSVQTDQSQYENFKKSNFMNAMMPGCSFRNPNIELKFSPRTALTFVHLNGSGAKDVKEMTISALVTSSQSGPSGDISKVKMYKYKTVSDDEVIWAAFLADQTLAVDAVIEYSDGSNTFTSQAAAGIVIKGGKVNTIYVNSEDNKL